MKKTKNDERFFIVASDTHIGNHLTEKTIKKLNAIKFKDAKLLILAGDLTENGKIEEYNLIKNFIEKKEEEGKIVIPLLGNHDINNNGKDEFRKLFTPLFEKLKRRKGMNFSEKRGNGFINFSFNFGRAKILMLDYENPLKSQNTESYSWLIEQVRSAKNKIVIIISHSPVIINKKKILLLSFSSTEELKGVMEKMDEVEEALIRCGKK